MIHIIHLPQRADRLTLLLEELALQGITDYTIWPGIITEVPSLGIAMAHQQIVKWAELSNLPEVTIAEDDLLFTAPGAFSYYCRKKPQDFDLYLGGITYGEILPGNIVKDFSGTHLYTIHQKFFQSFLSLNGQQDIDRALKDMGRFVVCNPIVAIQRNGFSDNRKRNIDYSIYLNKRPLFGNRDSL